MGRVSDLLPVASLHVDAVFLNRNADYTLAGFHRTQDFRGYGTFELPFGPGKRLGTTRMVSSAS